MTNGICFKFDASHHADGLACLGSNRCSLANRTGATIEVVVKRCKNSKNCSSKLCLLLGPFEPRSLQRRCCALQKREDAKLCFSDC